MPGFRSFAVLCAALMLGSPSALAESAVDFMHRGVKIIGLPLPKGVQFDIDIIGAAKGAENIKNAFDVLYTKSPFSAQAVERLKSAGNVVVIYDPEFPKNEFTKVTIAAFFPDYYQKDGSEKNFVTVVGRFGAKWEADELAPILAHELTGHGMQHYRGRLEHVREVDLECEAYLYQEKAYQDLGYDKFSNDMVLTRQKLENHWCAEFKSWLAKNRPEASKLWDTLNPDVPKILTHYLAYIEDLRKTGVAKKAINLASALRGKETEARIAQLSVSDKPADHYELALIYSRGLGIKSDAKTAARWFRKAANADHERAQFDLARLYFTGKGVPKSKKRAALWAGRAAEQGNPDAAFIYGAMLVNGDGIERNVEEGKTWLRAAAEKGHLRAKAALQKLGN